MQWTSGAIQSRLNTRIKNEGITMATLAIKGHATRGKEVIDIFKMLDGQNYSHVFLGGTEYNYYYIGNYSTISCIPKENIDNSFVKFTLEEFIEKFPYKVGDKVKTSSSNDNCVGTIISMRWDDEYNEVIYTVKFDDLINSVLSYRVQGLQPYKEQEPMNIPETMKQITDIAENLIKIDIPKGYEFARVDNQQIVFEKIKPKYPKDFDECCYILETSVDAYFDYDDNNHYPNDYEYGLEKKLLCLRKLLICRDAYWKLAGDWNPDWLSSEDKFCIMFFRDKASFDDSQYIRKLLAFPTEEMRDAFYENFKDLIEQCKELL